MAGQMEKENRWVQRIVLVVVCLILILAVLLVSPGFAM